MKLILCFHSHQRERMQLTPKLYQLTYGNRLMDFECLLNFFWVLYYRPQTKLRKGNVFTPVCQSFCSGGVSGPVHAGIRHPTGRHPPPKDGYCCGRYASYWNAFLLIILLTPCNETLCDHLPFFVFNSWSCTHSEIIDVFPLCVQVLLSPLPPKEWFCRV